MSARERIHRTSGNVFTDLRVSNPKRVLARARIMSWIARIIRERRLTQQKASTILGIPQSKVSCLMHGKLHMFSLDHLFELLNALDSDVEIIIRPKTKEERVATTQVVMATSL